MFSRSGVSGGSRQTSHFFIAWRSIGFTWSKSDMTLRLHADEPYSALIEKKVPYLQAGMAAMKQAFGFANVEGQFATVPEEH